MPPGLPKLMLSLRTGKSCHKQKVTKCEPHVKIDIFISKTAFLLACAYSNQAGAIQLVPRIVAL